VGCRPAGFFRDKRDGFRSAAQLREFLRFLGFYSSVPSVFQVLTLAGVYSETYLRISKKVRQLMNYDISFNRKTAGVVLVGGILAGSLLFFSGYKIGLDRGAVRARAAMEKPQDAPPAPATVPSPATDTNSSTAGNAPQEPAVDANPTSDSYSVQIGVFLTEDAAQQLQRKFGVRGYSAFVFQGRDNTGQTWYAVRIGHFKDLAPATRTAVNFTMNERLPAHVRPANGL